MKILMVCLGNICRSPMAEGVMRNKLEENGVHGEVDSAGTSAFHIGEGPDLRARRCAKQHGIDISSQKARQFEVADFDRFDRIYAMDHSNYDNIVRMARTEEDKAKVKMILEEIYPGEMMPVPDPYYGGDDGFDNVYNLLDQACTKVVADIQQ